MLSTRLSLKFLVEAGRTAENGKVLPFFFWETGKKDQVPVLGSQLGAIGTMRDLKRVFHILLSYIFARKERGRSWALQFPPIQALGKQIIPDEYFPVIFRYSGWRRPPSLNGREEGITHVPAYIYVLLVYFQVSRLVRHVRSTSFRLRSFSDVVLQPHVVPSWWLARKHL